MFAILKSKSVLGLGLCMLCVACSKTVTDQPAKKPDETGIKAKLYPVQFQVANIASFTNEVGNKEMAVKDYLANLYYYAYDLNGKLVSKIEQDSGSHNNPDQKFGVLNDSLPAGKYTVVIAGSTFRPTPGGNEQLANLKFYWILDEFFFKKTVITVDSVSPQTLNTRLDRLTGQIEIKLTDTLPSDVYAVDAMWENQPRDYNAATQKGEFKWYNTERKMYNLNEPLVSLNLNVLGSDAKIQVILYAVDKLGNTLYQRRIDNIVVRANQKIILTGSLMATGNIDSTATPFTFDPDYGEPIIKNF